MMDQILILLISLLSAISTPDACVYIAASGRSNIVNSQKMSNEQMGILLW